MCVQYHGGAQYRGGCSVPWGYHEYRGGYLGYRGVFSTVGDIMINVGIISRFHPIFRLRNNCDVTCIDEILFLETM